MNKEKTILNEINALRAFDYIKNKNTYLHELDAIEKRVKENVFRIAVVGEFSSGKSTFINSLIGKDILSHAVSETTATITNIVNVDMNDDRLQTCDILYKSGEKKHLDKLDDLKEYTTAQSNAEVAEKICSVDVYVNFLNISCPLIITDTPGLNGKADLHSEITINEIKKAHACIYVLSLKGLTDSDTDFIKLLLNYQNRFIFVQNFIDALRSTEGETPTGKINELNANLDWLSKKYDEDGAFQYKIVGISALKALASKDKNIKRLYANSTNDILDEEREVLYKESNIEEFEKLLEFLFTSGEYKDYTIASAVQSIKKLVDIIDKGLITSAEIEKMVDDKSQNRIDRINEIIAEKEKNRGTRKRELNNFLDSQNNSFKRELKSFTDDGLKEIANKIEQEVDKKIINFEDIEQLGRNPYNYFIDMAAKEINTDLIPKIDNLIVDNFNHLYESALAIISKSVFDVQKSNFKVNVDTDKKLGNLSISTEKLSDIENDKRMLEEINQKLKQNENDIIKYNRMEIDFDAQRNLQLQNSMNLEEQHKRQLSALGSKPRLETKEERRTRKVSRSGLGRIFDCLFGEKTEVYIVKIQDDSKQKKWLQEKREIDNNFRRKKEVNQKIITELEDKITGYKFLVQQNKVKKIELEKEISVLQEQIKDKKKIYKSFVDNRKKELCGSTKTQIKEFIADKLLGDDDSVREKIKKHITEESEKYLYEVRKKVMEVFDDDYNKMISKLKETVDKNQGTIDHKVEKAKKDRMELKRINETLNKI